MTKRKITTTIIVSVVLILTASAIALYFLIPKNLAQTTPVKIGEAKKVKTIAGKNAIAATKSSHIGKLKKPKETAIVSYEDQTMIWISKYDSSNTANKETEKMTKAMMRAGQGFENLSEINIGDVKLFRAKPEGNSHYFWQHKNTITYIAPGNEAAEQIEDLVRQINSKTDLYFSLN